MPGGDGTGPWWAQGRWSCQRGRGWSGSGSGRGYGRGFGRGYGMAYAAGTPATYQPAPQTSKEDELSELKSYAAELKDELEEVKKRMAALEKSD